MTRIYAYTNVNKCTYGCSISCGKENKKGETNDEEEGNIGKGDWCAEGYRVNCFSSFNSTRDFFYLSFSFFVVDKCKKYVSDNEAKKSKVKL